MFLSKNFKLFFSFFIFLSFNICLKSENRFSWGALKEKRQSLAYKSKSAFKKSKNFVLKNIVFPTLIKWEELREEGITKKDAAKLIGFGCGTLATCYLLKTTGLYKATKEVLTKKNVGSALLVSASAYGIYHLWKKHKEKIEKTRKFNAQFDDFLANLSQEQHDAIINSTYLFNEVLNGFENPVSLLNCKDFMDLLDAERKEKLKIIVLGN